MKLPYYIKEVDVGLHILGKQFRCEDYSIFTMEDITDPCLEDIYDLMNVILNNAHNEKENIVLVFMQKEDSVDLALIHGHIEDANTWNLTAMVRILLELEYITNSEATIELWDNYMEKFLIHIPGVPYSFTKDPKKLKNNWILHYRDKCQSPKVTGEVE